MNIKSLLNEKITKVSQDVDMIFNAGFKDAFDYIDKTGKVTFGLLNKESFNSSILKSKKSQAAHKINPIKIFINNENYDGNAYSPDSKYIALNIHTSAWRMAQQHGSIDTAVHILPPGVTERFKREFVKETIKGSIHHELNHWIDDSLNNRHIQKHVDVARDKGISPQDNTGSHERNSQIHNIVQLKRILNKKWDTLSFEEMVQYIPSMGAWSLKLELDEFTKWKRLLLRRMSREGLLGLKMGRT